MNYPYNTTGRAWMITIHIQNMISAGLSKEEYEDPQIVAEHFVSLWEHSGNNRKAAIVVCNSAQGLYHAHMACYGNSTTLKNVASILSGSHVEPQLGGKRQLINYLLKKGEFADKGESILYSLGIENIQDSQGKRSDIELIQEMLDNGLTPNDILSRKLNYCKYDKMIRQYYFNIRLKKAPIIKTMNNEYHLYDNIKSELIYTDLINKEPGNVYLYSDYSNSSSSGGGFDFYNGENTIMLDDFRGQLPLGNLLSILDKYSQKQIHCRFQNVYAIWSSVIICSRFSLEMVYDMMTIDSKICHTTFDEFLEKFNKVVYHYTNNNGEQQSFELSASEYVNAEDMVKKALDS